jgi:hypothetical protein
MIKIKFSLLEEDIEIKIDGGVISIDSKNKASIRLIESIYSDFVASYGPSDGSFGSGLAQELAKVGAKIIEVDEPLPEEGVVY